MWKNVMGTFISKKSVIENFISLQCEIPKRYGFVIRVYTVADPGNSWGRWLFSKMTTKIFTVVFYVEVVLI